MLDGMVQQKIQYIWYILNRCWRCKVRQIVKQIKGVANLCMAPEAIFKEQPEQLLFLQVKEYTLIMSDQFLVALSQSPTLIATRLVLS